MTREFYLDDVLLTGAVDLREDADGIAALTSIANYGETGSGGVTIHDVAASRNVVGWHRFHAIDTDATPQRLWTGYIYGRRIVRLNPSDGSRSWDCDLNDIHSCLVFRVFTEEDTGAKRPAENDTARLTWLLGTDQVAGLFEDTGLANQVDNARILPPTDYRHQFPGDVLRDIAGRCGKQFFLYYDEAEDAVALFYDLASAATFQSTLRISNDDADEDADTIGPMDDTPPQVFRDPSDQYSGVDLQYAGGAVYLEDDDTAAAMGIRRDLVHSSSAIGKRTTALSQATTYLEMKANETDTVRLALHLSSARVNRILAGSAVEVKLTHEPGYEAFVWTRVVQRVLELDGPGRYIANLELSLNVKGAPAGGNPGGFPQQGCAPGDVSLEQEKYEYPVETGVGPWTYTGGWDTSPEPGRLLYAAFLMSAGALPDTRDVAGWQFEAEGMVPAGDGQKYVAVYSRIAGAAEPTAVALVIDGIGFGGLDVRLHLQEWAGVDTVDAVAVEEDITTSTGQVFTTITPTLGLPFALLVASSGIDGNVSNLGTMPGGVPTLDDEVHPVTHETWNIVHQLVTDTTGSYVIGTDRTTGANGVVVALALSCSSSANTPLPGQPVPPNTPSGDVDGSNTDFTTPHPFAAGSLRVLHDGIDQTSHIASFDEDTGDFTLDYAPSAGSTIETYYQGHP